MKLYVGNLAFSTSEADVRTIFEQAGAVGSCELVSDKFTGQSRGFAFVEMESSAEGSQAIQRFNDYELDGRKMVVNEARPREARSGGFGGFGGGGFGAPSGSRGPSGGAGGAGGAGAFGAKRKSGKGSRRNARSAKRDRKACW
jgi:RNA recognition motif-containing protein